MILGERGFVGLAKLEAIPFMQYRLPLGVGPSLKRWPKCAPHLVHTASVRCIPRVLSSRKANRAGDSVVEARPARAGVKLGVRGKERLPAFGARVDTSRASCKSALLKGGSVSYVPILLFYLIAKQVSWSVRRPRLARRHSLSDIGCPNIRAHAQK